MNTFGYILVIIPNYSPHYFLSYSSLFLYSSPSTGNSLSLLFVDVSVIFNDYK
jgi:hypothetical protein